MRRSVRLAARTVDEITSRTAEVAQISGSKSTTNFTGKKEKSAAKAGTRKPQKSTTTKRNREKSTNDQDENEQKVSTLKTSGITEEKVVPKVKRVKTNDLDIHTTINHEDKIPSLFNQGKLVGAHVSIAGGLHNAVTEALAIGAQAFGLFLRSQRQWNSKPLEDKAADLFKEACAKANFSPHSILPHGIYLMNCGSPDEETLSKSRSTLVDELQRCEKLGLCLYNFHPGSTCGKITVEESIDRIAESINLAHKKTKYVVTVLENMSCQGNTVSSIFCFVTGQWFSAFCDFFFFTENKGGPAPGPLSYICHY